MTQSASVYPASRNGGIANEREICAYAIAEAIKIALSFALSLSGLLTPAYMLAYRGGGAIGALFLSATISVFWAAVLVILFLALRAALGGVPTMIAEPGRANAFTSRGGEIGAYVIAAAILIVVMSALTGAVLGPFYVALNHAGQEGVAIALGVTVATASAAAVYAIFIGLRSAFCRR